jgi:DNA-binding transcriptional LysR family regulator
LTDLNQLKLFVQVAEAENFTVAAKRLRVSKSSISRAIRELEDRLGVRLIERTTRNVSLTEAGNVYMDACRRVLEDAEQADLAVTALLKNPRGRLRVGVPAIFARSVLAPILGDFFAAWPELSLSLQFLSEEDSLGSKNLDIEIRSGPLENSGLLVSPIVKIRRGIYASPVYLTARETPNTVQALRKHTCITGGCSTFGDPGNCSVWQLRKSAEVEEVVVQSRVSVPDPLIAHQIALSGVGIALLAQKAAQGDVARGQLIWLLREWEPEPIELYALYPRRLSSSSKVRAFVQFLRERLNGKQAPNVSRNEAACRRRGKHLR